MPEYLFNSAVPLLVSTSVKRARIKSETDRQSYATELIDTYSGFSKKYIEDLITKKTSNATVKNALLEMVICYPFIQTFVDEISMVYASNPTREFYIDGKKLVDTVPVGGEGLYFSDPKLSEQLKKIYSKKLEMQIKKTEVMTNLLQTAVYKVNNRNKQIGIDFVPNDTCSVAPLVDDITAMGAIYFLRDIVSNGVALNPVYEQWDAFNFKIKNGNAFTTEPNEAAELAESYWGSRVIESGIPPFCVFRTELPDDDFWNIKDQDLIDTVKQINLAMTELRYLIRYSSFGLKYIANIDIAGERTLDPLGIWNLKSSSKMPGGSQKDWEVGELKNEGRLNEVVESIKFYMTVLFNFYGISMNTLVGSGAVQSAESKAMDRASVARYVRYQKDIWQLNENALLKNIICVWNRDNVDKLPSNISVNLAFKNDDELIDDLLKRAELWVLKIQSNVSSAIDWIKSENPNLNDSDAAKVYAKNKSDNVMDIEEPELEPESDA